MVTLVLTTLLFEALMPVATIARGGISDIMRPREAVVRSAGEWQALWHAHAGAGAVPPPVDFSRQQVVGVFLGMRSSGGFAVEITDATEEAGALLVHYVETTPGTGAMTAQVITAPFHIVSLPRTRGEVRFVRTEHSGRR
jgi:hypothetical protein